MSALTCLACRRDLPADMFALGTRRTYFCQDCRDNGRITNTHRLTAKRMAANEYRKRHSAARTPLTPLQRRERQNASNREYMRRRRADGDPWYTPVRLRAA